MHKPAVLIIGKPGQLQEGLEARLRTAGCRVLTASNGRSGVAGAAVVQPDIVLVDWELPDADALEVCREIGRQQSRRPPVFLLTPERRPDGAGGGAASEAALRHQRWDYFEYGFGALLAWIETASGNSERIVSGGLELDRRRFAALLDGRDLGLTTTEFRLLWALACEAGRVFQRRELAAACGSADRTRERTVDVHVKAIRDKLGTRAFLLETVQRVGYRFREWNGYDQTLSSRSGEPAAADPLAVLPGGGHDR